MGVSPSAEKARNCTFSIKFSDVSQFGIMSKSYRPLSSLKAGVQTQKVTKRAIMISLYGIGMNQSETLRPIISNSFERIQKPGSQTKPRQFS